MTDSRYKEWLQLCHRPSGNDPKVTAIAAGIIERVRSEGDAALHALAAELDGYDPEEFRVSREDITRGFNDTPQDVLDAIKQAYRNISAFHSAQMPQPVVVETAPGVRCFQKPVPIRNVGLYIPGGTAPLFSTVLMLAIPAKLAGCPRVVLCSPAGKDGNIAPAVLAAASVCEVDEIYKVGGAQAIAAMALGTESIPRVDKIFGPGNRFVTAAKQILGGKEVAIDMPAGPSEVAVMADSSANPAFVASDLLSQAEHGPDSQTVLVCHSREFADAVWEQIAIQKASLPRAAFVESSLSHSRTVVCSGVDEMAEFVNMYAPEHLIISMQEPWKVSCRIVNAGSIFIGNYSPESAGDYASGTNHTLPTSGWARAFSGVNMDSYFKKITIQELTRDGLAAIARTVVSMAEAEGLSAHANAVRIRLSEND